MSKGYSALFEDTMGDLALCEEDYYPRYTSSGSVVVDFALLPGSLGIVVPHRLSVEQMTFLTQKYDVEFAQVYVLGNGKKVVGGNILYIQGITNPSHFLSQKIQY